MRDTLRFEPVAGAKVRIMRNLLVNGAATHVNGDAAHGAAVV
jgi:hypothetical protein